MIVTLTWTPNLFLGFTTVVRIASYFGMLFLFFIVARLACVSIHKLMWYYILGVLSVGVYIWITGYNLGERLSLFGGNPTWYAAFLVWSIIGITIVYPRSKTSGKVLSIVGLIILILLLLLTQGRNSIISLGASLLVSFIVYIKNVFPLKKSQISVMGRNILILVIVLLVVGFLLYGADLYERLPILQRTFLALEGDYNRATAGRTIIWANYIDILSLNIALVGGGVNSAELIYGDYFINRAFAPHSPHNVYLLIMVEYGLIGMILWLSFLFGLIKIALLYKNRSFSLVWLAFVFPFLGVGNDILYYKYCWIGLIIFMLLFLDCSKKFASEKGEKLTCV